MKFLIAYPRLYAHCVLEALKGILKSPWTLLLPIGIAFVMLLLTPVLAPLRWVGGFLLGLALAFLSSAYLYFLGGVVAKQHVSLKDLRTALLTYFWSVINVGFVFWIANMGLDFALKHNPNGPAFRAALNILALIAMNAAPEVIYLKGTVGGIDTIQRSVKFLQENWIEWFIPNGLIIAAGYYFPALRSAAMVAASPEAVLIGAGLLGGILGHVVMVFRGQLFQELEGSTHRQRVFKYGRIG
jgi:hypothetical protein